MMSQTITLIRFFLTAYSSRKNIFMLFILLMLGALSGQFIYVLSLSNAQAAQLALQIEFYRYTLALLSVLMLIVSVAEDYDSKQFEQLLSMPLHRWQYLVAQMGSIALINGVICLLSTLGLLLFVTTDITFLSYWFSGFWLELMLVSFIALLAVISLEKIPTAFFLTLSLYVLARLSDAIEQIISMSVEYSEASTVNVLMSHLFSVIQLVLPGSGAFLNNNLFFTQSTQVMNLLLEQASSVSMYGLFLMAIILFDFYRKDFALK